MKTRIVSLAMMASALALAGCSGAMPSGSTLTSGSTGASVSKPAIVGTVHGGQAPMTGAHVYVYAAGTGGYGSDSASLLQNVTTGAFPTTQDGNGHYYVTTDAQGSFGLTGSYTCPTPSSQVYMLSVSGNPGGPGMNDKSYLMAAMGNCQALIDNANTTFITIDEVSTVAGVYALAPFMNSATQIGAPASNQAGLTTAFSEVPSLIGTTFGLANQTTSGGNGTVPLKLINTLADFIAVCVNSNGAVTGGNTTNCDMVFSPTTVNSVVPGNTIEAALAVVRNPANNVSTIVQLPSPTAPFQPVLTSAADLTMGVSYAGGNIQTPQGVAIDASGNVWVPSINNTVAELQAGTGSFLSGPTGYNAGPLDGPTSIAVDTSGNVWIANCGGQCTGSGNPSTVTKYVPGSGSVTAANFNDPSLTAAYSIAIDGSDNIWAANALGANLTVFNSAGTVQSGTTGYTSTFQSGPVAVAIDGGGNAWSVSPSSNALSEFTNAGGAGTNSVQGTGLNYPFAVAIDSTGRQWVANESGGGLSVFSGGALSGSALTGGGLSVPNALVLDGAGTAWVTNSNGSISAFTSGGTAITPASGFSPAPPASYVNGVAVDGAGSLWLSSCGSYCTGSGSDPGAVVQVIGAATPVVTPIALGVKNNALATKP